MGRIRRPARHDMLTLSLYEPIFRRSFSVTLFITAFIIGPSLQWIMNIPSDSGNTTCTFGHLRNISRNTAQQSAHTNPAKQATLGKPHKYGIHLLISDIMGNETSRSSEVTRRSLCFPLFAVHGPFLLPQ